VGLDLWIKEQNDRLRINIDAFTKIFCFVSLFETWPNC
jgi:hypothetical protein